MADAAIQIADAADGVMQVADAVLYEGYLLWPYRRSALKNQRRWTFGCVLPEAYGVASGGSEPWTIESEVLLDAGPDAQVDVCMRCLHVVERGVARVVDGTLESAEELVVRGERHCAWDEATERRVTTGALPVAGLPCRMPVDVPAGMDVERLDDGGAFVRSWAALRGTLDVRAERLGDRLHRLGVRIANTTPWHNGTRDDALRRSFVSTHFILRVDGGAFVSSTDPPDHLRDAAAACRNVGAWPVLAGQEGDHTTVLCAPIILYDWPRVAPESPGDLFDATEIDQMLVLNVLALTDEEQREMRASDARAAAILDRCAALSPEDRMRLHGAIRGLRAVRDA